MTPGLGAAASTLAAQTTTGEAVAFWILAPLAVAAAVGMLWSRKAVHSALFLAVTMLTLAVFYLYQDAVFLGIVQIVIYTGAVMMLFLFVLMLVGVDASDSLVETIRGQRVAAVAIGLGFGVLLVGGVGQAGFGEGGLDAANADGNVVGVARLIFTRYVYAFEVTGALLITAALGAMVLAHRERLTPRPTQKSLSQQRFLRGGQVSPLPPPGVFARHNAVDTPALLPDGTPSEKSVSWVLRSRGGARRLEEATEGAEVTQAEGERSTQESSQLGKGPTP